MTRRQGFGIHEFAQLARFVPAAVLLAWAAAAPAQPAPNRGPARPPPAPSPLAPALVAPPLAAPPLGVGADPIVANVEGHPIRLSDLSRASQTLPENLRSLPFETLYASLLERMIDHQALARMARRQGLDDSPTVRRDIDAATDRVLEAAYLAQQATPKVTDQAIQTRYNQQFANRPAIEEVRARHILVTTEAEAKDVLQQLRDGADFILLARAVSKDPDGLRGGDLGFFRREQVWPTFADTAFALSPGQVAPAPIRNEFGWHVVRVEERRLVAPPNLSEVRDALREELTTEAVRQAVQQARAQLVIHQFNFDGSEMGAKPAR